MNKSTKNLMIRVITKKMNTGLTFDEVITEYPRLTETEIEELREVILEG